MLVQDFFVACRNGPYEQAWNLTTLAEEELNPAMQEGEEAGEEPDEEDEEQPRKRRAEDQGADVTRRCGASPDSAGSRRLSLSNRTIRPARLLRDRR
jgi:hypothetical protein